jgi:putative ATPase
MILISGIEKHMIVVMKTPDLFNIAASKEMRHAPLADKMRPNSLDEFVGQEEILGKTRLLFQAIQTDQIPSMILWGPPGCGKTALALVIAKNTGADFVSFSAVLGGIKEIREIMKTAATNRDAYKKKTILFIDEIHRMNKAQQDGLLPHVEKGTVTLIGATTENPSFEVNAALLSRTKVFVLKPLDTDDLEIILQRALENKQRGLGDKNITIDDSALEDICRAANGDARQALNTLQVAAEYLEQEEEGDKLITQEIVKEAVQNKTLLYDRQGDEHYNIVSAFIKSLRGSDPDGAVYWMTRMLEAGEDPRFILRRMIIFASEDIGNADPQALPLATAALSAHEFVGLPESPLCLSQVATYLACAPKSNSALTAYIRARKDVHQHGSLPVPLHLRNAPTKLMKNMGYGKNYKYPHDFEGHYIAERYLPDRLCGRIYYTPSNNGFEQEISGRLAAQREEKESE